MEWGLFAFTFLFLLLCLVRYSTFIDVVFFLFLFPDFYSPLFFQPYGLAAEVLDFLGLLSFLFWFEGARWEVERSINRHI